jgi:hypothetical protein
LKSPPRDNTAVSPSVTRLSYGCNIPERQNENVQSNLLSRIVDSDGSDWGLMTQHLHHSLLVIRGPHRHCAWKQLTNYQSTLGNYTTLKPVWSSHPWDQKSESA